MRREGSAPIELSRTSMNTLGPKDDDDLTRFVERIRGEFAEDPGLRMTLRQAARFWTIEETVCARVLDGLVTTGYLTRDARQRYRRASAS